MNNSKWIKLPTLALCIAALGLVYCGEETTEEETPAIDAGSQLPDAGNKIDAGTQVVTDGGTTVTDGGTTKPTLPVLTNVTLKDIRANPGTYYDSTTFKTKAIVNVVGATVVSDYPHSAGPHSMYVEQGVGAEKAGMLVYYGGDSVPAIGSTVEISGCVNVRYGVVQIQYCDDATNTQAEFTNVVAGTVPALGASDTFAASVLAGTSDAQDSHLGLRIQVDGTLTADATLDPACTNTAGTFCVKMNDGVYIRTAFTYKCSAVQLAGPFTDLVGVWEWYQSGATKIRTVTPLTCDDLEAAIPVK